MQVPGLPPNGYTPASKGVVQEKQAQKQEKVTREVQGGQGASNTSNTSGTSEIKDVYESLKKDEKKVTYDKPGHKVDQAAIQKLKEESEQSFSQLRDIVRQMLERQGLTFNDLAKHDADIEVDEQARQEAQSMIAEGGPLSPETVSDNIVNFAKQISGGDKEKLDMLRSAISKGFEQATEMLGGELPEISKQTYDMIMEKLDAWEND